MKTNYFNRIAGVIALLLFGGVSLFARTAEFHTNNQGYQFKITIATENGPVVLEGESDYTMTPSSYTITMAGDNGRCMMHMLNFTTIPEPGTYDVEDAELVRTALVCVFEVLEPLERLASHSGSFTITETGNGFIKGHFDMVMKGPISGKEYHLTGEVKSENLPSEPQFQPSQTPFPRQ
jgi:hypothetical protein